MRYHNDSIILFELEHKVLDLRGGDRIKRRGRLVHQQHLRVCGKRTRDADTLLLTAGHGQRGFFEVILGLLPDSGTLERGFNNLVKLHTALDAVRARTIGDVIINRHRERIRLLEYHADTAAQQIDVTVLVDILTIEHDVARDTAVFHQIVHAVERTQQRRLAAAGRPDECGDLILLDIQIDIVQGVKIAVMQIHIVNFDLIFHVHSPFTSWSAFSLPERKAYSSAGPPAAERLR